MQPIRKISLRTSGGSFVSLHVCADQSFDEAGGCSFVNAAAGRLEANLITRWQLNSILFSNCVFSRVLHKRMGNELENDQFYVSLASFH
jgi:hypothetical protein